MCRGLCAPVRHRANIRHSGVCQWCNQPASTRCHTCRRGIHYVGECLQWLRGAHAVYRQTPHEPAPTCPDCRWQVAQVLMTLPRQAMRSPPPLLDSHMDIMARAVQPGAGDQSRQRRGQASTHRASNITTQILCERGWVRVNRVIRDATAAATAEHPDPEQPALWAAAIRRAIDNHVRQGRAVLAGHRGRQWIRWGPPPCDAQIGPSQSGRRRQRASMQDALLPPSQRQRTSPS